MLLRFKLEKDILDSPPTNKFKKSVLDTECDMQQFIFLKLRKEKETTTILKQLIFIALALWSLQVSNQILTYEHCNIFLIHRKE